MAGPTSGSATRPFRARGLADLALAGFVAFVLVVLVAPLPAGALDVLLASNLALSVLLLAAVLQARSPLALTAFPSVLLVTTLYRLALEVAASRRILGEGDGGALIEAFGRVVVRGDYLVGAVVFVILSVVQYVVIAKGAERVAEVAARFTLDALPGRQLAIDAELRAGALDPDEARRRRRELSRESQFHGAMDGAMRFVKGDAIAGLVIVAANLLGGVAVGALHRGMPLGRALARYGLLAIGQGLVAQLPALVISTAAGILVTRVAGEDPSASLGEDIGAQVLGEPQALAATAVVAGALSLAPGLPWAPFAALSALFGLGAWAASARARRREFAQGVRATTHATEGSWACSVETVSRLGRGRLEARLDEARRAVSEALGVTVPALALAVTEGAPKELLVLTLRGSVAHREALAPGASLDEVGARAEAALRARAGEFLGVQEAQAMLDALERDAPSLVRAVVPGVASVVTLSDVLRGLVEEGVSVRNQRDLFESLARAGEGARDPASLLERARVALRRELTTMHAPEGTLHAWTLDPLLEDLLGDAARRAHGGPLDVALQEDLASAVRASMGARVEGAVLLTRGALRRHVRASLAPSHPGVVVLAFEELEPSVKVHPGGMVRPVEPD